MKATYKKIKRRALNRIYSRFGDSVLITMTPHILFSLVFTTITIFIPVGPRPFILFLLIFSLIASILASYISIKLLLRFAKGRDGVHFDDFFDFDRSIISFFILRSIYITLILIPFIMLIPLYIELYKDVVHIYDPIALRAYLESSPVVDEIMQKRWISLSVSVMFYLLFVRFSLSHYLVIDKNMGIAEALQTSFRITKGNFFRILLFPFSFLLWFILIFFTFGLAIFFVLPYTATSFTHLYLSILEENNLSVDYSNKVILERTVDDYLSI